MTATSGIESERRPVVIDGLAALEEAVGSHLGHSGWHLVNQSHIGAFADLTHDHQWIHVDESRAATGPFGGTVAHGFLTLSLVPMLMEQVYEVRGMTMGVNYGAERLRFPAPVLAGTRIRAGVEVLSVRPVRLGHQLITRITVEREGEEKPACVVDLVAVLAF